MLDINLFRTCPDIIYQSQKARFASTEIVDQVCQLDSQWKIVRSKLDNLNRSVNLPSKAIGKKIKSGIKPEPSDSTELPNNLMENPDTIVEADLADLTIAQLKELSKYVSTIVKQTETELKTLETEINKRIKKIGNIVHSSVPVSSDEADNKVIRTWGDCVSSKKPGLKNHVELMGLISGIDTAKGAEIAGNRGYFMKGRLVQLHMGLVNYSLQFLATRGYTPLYTPVFMNQSSMSRVAQLEQFDEELYKVTGESDDKYLIATSEQPIAAYHMGEWIDGKSLPIQYAGFSSCFRKEVGKHGKDTLGIFRVHQFEKIEQFCICEPDKSWAMWESMINTSEQFYQSLGIPYQVVSIVSGALNNAAAAKYDLEGYFPASNTFRELVSCSNCTDYQARAMETRLANKETKEYVHMLNSTLCATTRTLCILCELGQTDTGIKVPDVLVPFVGFDFIPFLN